MMMHIGKFIFVSMFVLGFAAYGTNPETELLKFVPEAKDYKLVYSANIFQGVDKLGNFKYDKDESAAFMKKPFSKTAYYLRLVGKDDKVQQVFVTMDAFTNDVKLIGIPMMNPRKALQMMVSNLTVKSDVPGVTGGTFQKGNIEFWATNYGPGNSMKVPGASDQLYDFGDTRAPNGNYGSMQIHNFMEKQVVFAVNHWIAGQNADIGIGNRPSKNAHPDWTFSKSGANYKTAQLLILVK